MDAGRVQHHFVAVMAKHLPPSASTLRLLDLDGRSGCILSSWRSDLDITRALPADLASARLASEAFDAIVAFDISADGTLLSQSLKLLRPGGRLIMLQSRGKVSQTHARMLREYGYTRLLVEPALDDLGVLLRGEKPHRTSNTAQRVRSVAQADGDLLDLEQYTGRYLHLLIQQRPNKPVWKLRGDETITWHAAAVEQGARQILLAFSSLPKAVGFMQPAVLKGLIRDVNKVGKFSRGPSASLDLGRDSESDFGLNSRHAADNGASRSGQCRSARRIAAAMALRRDDIAFLRSERGSQIPGGLRRL